MPTPETSMQDQARISATPSAGMGDTPSRLQRLAGFRIGIMPLPLILVGLACLISFVVRGQVPGDLCIMAVVLSTCAFTLSAIGHRIPVLRSLGGAVILNTFLPSALVFYGLMPAAMTKSIGLFFRQSNFLYLFVAAVVVGSIFAIGRKTLLANLVKILVPLAISSVAATVVGLAVGAACGLDLKYTLFYILAPLMAGGVGEGALPLAIGYAAVTHGTQAGMVGQILPIVAMSNVCAIVIAGLLHSLGTRRPALTGNGVLLVGDANHSPRESSEANDGKPLLSDVRSPAVAGLTLLMLYAVSAAVEHLVDLPAPLIMLLLAVVLKMARLVPSAMEQGTR
jgi:Na+/citrate or Na+/malate symporter